MTGDTSRDAWQSGSSYETYMGRWSRQVAPRFLHWLNARQGLDWLEIGCGTGAFSAAIMAEGDPGSLVGIDSSEPFITAARAAVPDERATFLMGDAQALPVETASKDMIVSALVLNFVPDREKALAEMKRVARSGATIGFYVWDYPGGGLEFVHAFWSTAAALDHAAAEFAEDRRFAFCTRHQLTGLAKEAGLRSVASVAIEVPTVFRDYEDYWQPFVLGTGPAPRYCAGLEPDARQRLRESVRQSLPCKADGSIELKVRAWGIKAVAG